MFCATVATLWLIVAVAASADTVAVATPTTSTTTTPSSPSQTVTAAAAATMLYPTVSVTHVLPHSSGGNVSIPNSFRISVFDGEAPTAATCYTGFDWESSARNAQRHDVGGCWLHHRTPNAAYVPAAYDRNATLRVEVYNSLSTPRTVLAAQQFALLDAFDAAPAAANAPFHVVVGVASYSFTLSVRMQTNPVTPSPTPPTPPGPKKKKKHPRHTFLAVAVSQASPAVVPADTLNWAADAFRIAVVGGHGVEGGGLDRSATTPTSAATTSTTTTTNTTTPTTTSPMTTCYSEYDWAAHTQNARRRDVGSCRRYPKVFDPELDWHYVPVAFDVDGSDNDDDARLRVELYSTALTPLTALAAQEFKFTGAFNGQGDADENDEGAGRTATFDVDVTVYSSPDTTRAMSVRYTLTLTVTTLAEPLHLLQPKPTATSLFPGLELDDFHPSQATPASRVTGIRFQVFEGASPPMDACWWSKPWPNRRNGVFRMSSLVGGCYVQSDAGGDLFNVAQTYTRDATLRVELFDLSQLPRRGLGRQDFALASAFGIGNHSVRFDVAMTIDDVRHSFSTFAYMQDHDGFVFVPAPVKLQLADADRYATVRVADLTPTTLPTTQPPETARKGARIPNAFRITVLDSDGNGGDGVGADRTTQLTTACYKSFDWTTTVTAAAAATTTASAHAHVDVGGCWSNVGLLSQTYTPVAYAPTATLRVELYHSQQPRQTLAAQEFPLFAAFGIDGDDDSNDGDGDAVSVGDDNGTGTGKKGDGGNSLNPNGGAHAYAVSVEIDDVTYSLTAHVRIQPEPLATTTTLPVVDCGGGGGSGGGGVSTSAAVAIAAASVLAVVAFVAYLRRRAGQGSGINEPLNA
jgi:hypothetical protein